MRFLTFLKNELDTNDEEINGFSKWLFSLPRVPQSSDPAILGMFLQDKIPTHLIVGYKKAFLTYATFEKNQLPKRYTDQKEFLNMLNIV